MVSYREQCVHWIEEFEFLPGCDTDKGGFTSFPAHCSKGMTNAYEGTCDQCPFGDLRTGE